MPKGDSRIELNEASDEEPSALSPIYRGLAIILGTVVFQEIPSTTVRFAVVAMGITAVVMDLGFQHALKKEKEKKTKLENE